ncbi:methyltransferase [Polyangium aurulentum]|uniref:methyltransferase n=1 Tax=Polyangium aurulentum TaxID=2567896 RepID=UPI00146BFA0B|nr:methyltransferase [Polyangium aurulentum]UQA58802.1 SAM-dependent methyltransferase [Polyangium aurulentum]
MSDTNEGRAVPPPVMIMNHIHGMMLTFAMRAAAELEIADLVAGGPRSVEELARVTGTQERALYRILRALAGAGIFAELPERRFGPTPTSHFLRKDVPGSLRDWVRLAGADWNVAALCSVLDCARTGKDGYELSKGMRMFDWFEQHAEARQIFDGSMTDVSSLTVPAIVATYDFSRIERIVDVAGGHGALLAAILEANPGLSGTLFDVPSVIRGARASGPLTSPGLAGRVAFVEGDFFQAIPPGHDAYIMKWIVHDWNDEEARRLFRVCRQAMDKGKRLLVAETIVEEGNLDAKVMDLAMMSATGGIERTEAEFRALFEATGFTLARVVRNGSPMSVLEAVAV